MSQQFDSPPPPPPPPAPVVLSSVSHKNNEESPPAVSKTHDTYFSTPVKEARTAYHIFMKEEKRQAAGDGDSFVFVSSYHPVKPVIQNGPLCGMVALSMATGILNDSASTTENIFSEAKELGYSLQGEMFSAHSMQKLAAKFVPRSVQALSVKCEDKKTDGCQGEGSLFTDALSEGHLILVPYDADKNHGPFLANGHKAHWALVTGFFAVFKKSILPEFQSLPLEADEEIPCLYHLTDSCPDVEVETAMKKVLKCTVELYVFAHQGKSKYCGIWKLRELLSSNDNLSEVGPGRMSEDYVIPDKGIENELKGKIVLIQNKKR